jgi:uroporphyrinogen-III synthase
MRDAVSSVSAVNNQTNLATLALDGKTVSVQLYGDEVNAPLMSFLASYGAKPLPVFPYRYAPAAETEAVAALVEDLIAGRIQVLALTSTVQWQRLRQVAGIRLPAMAEAERLVKASALGG